MRFCRALLKIHGFINFDWCVFSVTSSSRQWTAISLTPTCSSAVSFCLSSTSVPKTRRLKVWRLLQLAFYLGFYAPPFEEWWRGIKCYPCPCVRLSEIWCPLNNFWKTASIQFKFGMLIYNIKTQVKFDLGYNPLIFDGVMGLYKNIVNAFSGGIRVLWTHF